MDWPVFVSLCLGTICACLASAVGWLFHTVGACKVHIAELRTGLEGKQDRAEAAEKYVDRQTYVPRITIIDQKLDSLAGTLARVDERSRKWDDK